MVQKNISPIASKGIITQKDLKSQANLKEKFENLSKIVAENQIKREYKEKIMSVLSFKELTEKLNTVMDYDVIDDRECAIYAKGFSEIEVDYCNAYFGVLRDAKILQGRGYDESVIDNNQVIICTELNKGDNLASEFIAEAEILNTTEFDKAQNEIIERFKRENSRKADFFSDSNTKAVITTVANFKGVMNDYADKLAQSQDNGEKLSREIKNLFDDFEKSDKVAKIITSDEVAKMTNGGNLLTEKQRKHR